MRWLDRIACRHVVGLSPYESARRLFSNADSQSDSLWLNANEAPETGETAILDDTHFNRYPDCQPEELITKYAKYCGRSNDEVIATRGADEGIELLIRAFCEPGFDNILICPPTYGMYAISAYTFNIGVSKAKLLDDFTLDVPEVLSYKGKVKLVFLCSPNNPTGTTLDLQTIRQVAETFKDESLVVVDEAYIEFSTGESAASLLDEFDNLVILRTLSKAFALAGIRCGFTIANPSVIALLMKVIAPYPIPEPVAQLASFALSEDGVEKTMGTVSKIKASLADIKQTLSGIEGVEIVGDTEANFVLFRHEKNQQLMQHLVHNKVYIRDQSKQHLLNNCLRITAGTADENARVLSIIKSFFEDEKNLGGSC